MSSNKFIITNLIAQYRGVLGRLGGAWPPLAPLFLRHCGQANSSLINFSKHLCIQIYLLGKCII